MPVTTPNPYSVVAEDPALAMSLPQQAYLDSAVFDAEVERVLKGGWLPVARSADLPESGDYRAVDLAGTPLVVTRDKDGALHVLSRVCRHRGMPVIEGAGNVKGLTCPYHLWRYGLDGRLASAPAMEQSKVFDRSDCDLPTIAHTEWGGWVFANLDGRASPLAPQLGPLADRLAAIAPERLVTGGVIDLESPWNWKIMVENFLESYHHIGPHAGTLQQSNPGLGTYVADAHGAFTILENPPAGPGHSPFVVACVFPLTLMFFLEGEMPLGVWYELDGIEVDRFRLRVHLLMPPEAAAVPEIVAGYREQVLHVHNEDIPVCEGIQAGVASQLYAPGPLSHLERSLWHFYRHLQSKMS